MSLRAPYWPIFLIICFYAIVHRRTIVQNKIISIICSFFVQLILIDNLLNVWLSAPNPNNYKSPNIHPRRIKKKGHSTPKWTDYDASEPDFEFSSNYIYFFK